MPLIETEGIVLQSRRFSETSKILVLFTRQQGKISVLLKGGRKGTKKFPGGLESLNRVSLVYYFRSSRSLQNLKSFELIDGYPQIRDDLTKTYTAWSIAETVLRCTADNDSNEPLYINLTAFLAALNVKPHYPWGVRWKCLLDVCRSLGFEISFPEQIAENGDIPRGFNLETGTFVTILPADQAASIITVTGEIWGVLRFLNRCTYEAAGRVYSNAAVGKRIENFFLFYFKYHIPGLKKFESWKKLPNVYWKSEDDP